MNFVALKMLTGDPAKYVGPMFVGQQMDVFIDANNEQSSLDRKVSMARPSVHRAGFSF
ncbi:MAG TPA: hypothetical protein VGM65_16995 [Candidatus Udaeobacter sp.]|jgi:hypothetical protein